jgi:hypothetical protein
MIDPRKFGKPPDIHGKNHFFPFGLDKDNIAVELRRLADGIESGLVIPQRIQCGSVSDIGEYVMQAIMIEFAEGVEIRTESSKEISLYGSGGFPVNIGLGKKE